MLSLFHLMENLLPVPVMIRQFVSGQCNRCMCYKGQSCHELATRGMIDFSFAPQSHLCLNLKLSAKQCQGPMKMGSLALCVKGEAKRHAGHVAAIYQT